MTSKKTTTPAKPKTKRRAAAPATNAVAVRQDQPEGPVGEVQALCALVERFVSDPSIDVSKLREIMSMRQELRAEAARMESELAFIDMQPDLPTIDKSGQIEIDEKDANNKKTGNKILVSKYAEWENINDIITPILAQHGFSLRFDFERDPQGGMLTAIAIITHRSGHQWLTRSPPLPMDATGSKNPTQGWGSASSYAKRYATIAALNIRTRDMKSGRDDDAAGASLLPKTISPDNAEALAARLAKAGASIPKFCAHFKIARVADLSPRQWEDACRMVTAKERQNQNGGH